MPKKGNIYTQFGKNPRGDINNALKALLESNPKNSYVRPKGVQYNGSGGGSDTGMSELPPPATESINIPKDRGTPEDRKKRLAALKAFYKKLYAEQDKKAQATAKKQAELRKKKEKPIVFDEPEQVEPPKYME